MTTDILLLCPLQGNGGIQSWTRFFISDFPDKNYRLYPVDIAPSKLSTHFRGVDSWLYGAKAFLRAYKAIGKQLRNNPQIQLMQTTTSGGNGVLRDYFLGRFCKKRGLKIILHCRYGCIRELYQDKGWRGKFFHKTLLLYDQIWVLDKQSKEILLSDVQIKEKVFLVPNPIEVPGCCNSQPKKYKKIGFIGNILPTKGVFELIEAIISLKDETELFIVGEGSKDDIAKLTKIINSNKTGNIKFFGRLSNNDAINMMSTLDIVCLPTYYEMEAFPISILEAMSLGKLVISCPRAAIPDMLTSLDGTPCGILIPEKSPQAIANAIIWCQEHCEEADLMCKKAYEKVYSAYRKDVVYNIYRNNYNMLIVEKPQLVK